jgi:L-threonylcarbamoyladenylate synthase
VAAHLDGAVDVILDAGPSAVGLESTVVDPSGPVPTLLRPGGVPVEALEAVLGQRLARAGSDDAAPSSPGMLTQHYAPRARVRLNAERAQPGEVLLGFGGTKGATLDLSKSGDLVEAAANLFAHLHALDDAGAAVIAVAPIPETGLGLAIADRLRRAAAGR